MRLAERAWCSWRATPRRSKPSRRRWGAARWPSRATSPRHPRWTRPSRGKERISAEHFAGITAWFGELQAKGTLTSWEPVFLQPHGGDLGGFFLLRGDPDKLHELTTGDAWEDHTMRASLHLDGFGVVGAYSGAAVGEAMAKWSKLI